MNYNKPEVKTLGDAKSAIESMGSKPQLPQIDGTPPVGPKPAYDLDE
jgi:hypothetical protein